MSAHLGGLSCCGTSPKPCLQAASLAFSMPGPWRVSADPGFPNPNCQCRAVAVDCDRRFLLMSYSTYSIESIESNLFY